MCQPDNVCQISFLHSHSFHTACKKLVSALPTQFAIHYSHFYHLLCSKRISPIKVHECFLRNTSRPCGHDNRRQCSHEPPQSQKREKPSSRTPRFSSPPSLIPLSEAPAQYPALMGVISSTAVVTLAFTVMMLRFMR